MGARQFKVVLVGGHTVGSYALIGSGAEACRPWLDKNYPVVIRQDTGHTIEIRPGTPPSITIGRGLRTPPRMGRHRRPAPERHHRPAGRHRCPMTASAATAGPNSTPTSKNRGAATDAGAATKSGSHRRSSRSTPSCSSVPANNASSRSESGRPIVVGPDNHERLAGREHLQRCTTSRVRTGGIAGVLTQIRSRRHGDVERHRLSALWAPLLDTHRTIFVRSER